MIFASLILIFLLRVVISWFEFGGWSTLILDLVVMLAAFFSIDLKQIIRVFKEWSFLKIRSHQKIKKRFNLDIFSSGLKFVSLFFVMLWFSRWIVGLNNILISSPDTQDLTYLDVFVFCQALALFLDTGKIRRFIMYSKITVGRQIILQYGVAIIIATPLLLMPFSLQAGQTLSLIDAMFVVVSAVSVTGLSPVDIGSVFSVPGLMILMILIQLGGLGIILVIAGFSVARFSRMSVDTILMGQEMYGSRAGDVPDFLGRVVMLTVAIEAMGVALLYMCLPSGETHRLLIAVFHSISAFCNAGFSTFSTSLQESPFHFLAMPIICVLIVLGGMGFPIILDLLSLARSPKKGFRHLTAYTRLTLTVMGFLLVAGAVLFFALETFRPDEHRSFFTRIGLALFYTISSRTAGFGTVPTETFHISSLFCLSFLMMLGANPASTGSGIKTTTVGVLFLAVYSSIKGKAQVVFAGRAIPATVVTRAITVVALYFFVACVATLILVLIEPGPVGAIAFEVISALSTVGYSVGITSELSVVGKVLIMILMLLGRIGILAVLLNSLDHKSGTKVRYPEDEFFVG